MTSGIQKGDLVEVKHTNVRGTVVDIAYCKSKGTRYKIKIGNLHTYGGTWICRYYDHQIVRVLPVGQNGHVSTIEYCISRIKKAISKTCL